MPTPTVETVRARLVAFKGRYPEICEQSGLDYSWLSKFASGERGKRPSFDLIVQLDRQLTAMEAAERAKGDMSVSVN
jgi:hypothetical protein